MSEIDAFRAEIRAWLEASCPPNMRTPAPESEDVWGGPRERFVAEGSRAWFDAAVSRGFTAPTWPKEYGGGGLSPAEARVLDEELKRIGARMPLKSFGLWMLGPVLLQFGNEAQKRRFVPRIVQGLDRWCQGYSEPGAGSDLASLSCRADRDGDHYVVNGQKVWTSHADKADWMFCLVRTGTDGPKHDGISFLLIDMKTPGVSVRPIRLISGASPFCETFFDNVRVPVENLVGAENRGWTVAKALLEHERSLISKLRDQNTAIEEPLHATAVREIGLDERGVLADASLRERVTRASMDFLANRLTLRRSAAAREAGKAPGPETSMFKLYGTELNKRRRELLVLIHGYRCLGWEGDPVATPDELQTTKDWLRSRANSIEGGSSEIQLNIIAKRVLNLPD